MFIALFFVCIFTSIVSGVIGMGGGVLLLSCMTLFLPLSVIVPIHGCVQLISNSSRVLYLKDSVKWDYFKVYIIGLPIGMTLSVLFLKTFIQDQHIYILIISIILYAIFKPKKLPPIILPQKYWWALGILTGAVSILIGAVGPLIAPFFIRDDFTKKEIVSTKAMMQTVAHLLKIPAFLALDFAYKDHMLLIIILSFGAILGTYLGVKLLDRVNENLFRFMFKSVLGVAALRLIYKFFEG